MRLCWLSPFNSGESLKGQGIRCQPRKASRGAFFVPKRFASEPGDAPDDIHGRGVQELLQVRPRQPNVPTAAEIKATHCLGESTFHPGPQGILCTELRRLFRAIQFSNPRSRGLSEHGAFSCEECCIPAHLQGWGEGYCGKKGQQWVVARDIAGVVSMMAATFLSSQRHSCPSGTLNREKSPLRTQNSHSST